MVNKDYISKQLESFGLDDKEVRVYLCLLERGIMSPLKISRFAKVNRTTVYRVLETLKRLELVETVLDKQSVRVKAERPYKLEMIVARKQAEIAKLQSLLPNLVSCLSALESASRFSLAKVIYFNGKKELWQLFWNILNAGTKTEVIGYRCVNWTDVLGRSSAKKLIKEFILRKIFLKEIVNIDQLGDEKEFGDCYRKIYEKRPVLRSKLEISNNTYMYNDVFSFYSSYRGKLFGVEVHNKEIVKTQRQIFYFLWEMLGS